MTNFTKCCTKCNITKSLNDYYFVKTESGFRPDSNCKECKSKAAKKYYKKNSAKIKIQAADYYQNNKKRHREVCLAYLKRNPELSRYVQQKLYAKEHGIEFDMTREDYKQLMKYLRCEATGEQLSLEDLRGAFVSRIRMDEPYSPDNMEITKDKPFYDKLTDHNLNLREGN